MHRPQEKAFDARNPSTIRVPQRRLQLVETEFMMIKHQGREWRVGDDEWPRWVRMGWIPPDALVNSPRWTRGLWRTADSLEVYHLFRPSPKPAPAPQTDTVKRHGPFGMFRGPGPSITEWLIIVNILIGVVLYLTWGEQYSTELWAYSAQLKERLGSGFLPALMIPVFLHATPAHLLGNMITFVAAGAVVEEFYGRKRMILLYLFSGLTSSLLSLARTKDVLSVGASGAIMGMYGVGLVFLLRERRHFSESQRYRLRRVQIPFFFLLVLPSILHADFYAHLGGFLGGALLALFVAPLTDRLPRPGHLPEEPMVTTGVVPSGPGTEPSQPGS